MATMGGDDEALRLCTFEYGYEHECLSGERRKRNKDR